MAVDCCCVDQGLDGDNDDDDDGHGDNNGDNDGDDDDDDEYAPTSPPRAKFAPEGTHNHES